MISSSKLLKAIRKKCIDCCGDMKEEVLKCDCDECPLHPYRLGLGSIGKKKEEDRKKKCI